MPVPYDPANPDWSSLRRIFMDWIASDPNGQFQFGEFVDLSRFVQYVNNNEKPQVLTFHLMEVFWQLLVEGIVAPGINSANQNLPYFHVTDYGRTVLTGQPGNPHDEAAYLASLHGRVPLPDQTVLAYLKEALNTFRRGTPVASTVMLGIAAERVFLMVSDSMLAALRDPQEKTTLGAILQRFPMKPKLDWVHAKVREIESRRLPGFPDNAGMMVMAVYDFLRAQRNDLGHPRERPPQTSREDAHVNLQMFLRYYQVAEELRKFLGVNQV